MIEKSLKTNEEQSKQQSKSSTLFEAAKTLLAVLQASHRVVPGCVFVSTLLVLLAVRVAVTSDTLMTGGTFFVVLFVSILIFARTNDYGQSAIALVSGLLAVFSVSWSSEKFILFCVAWVIFTGFSLMISSLKLAGEMQTIYLQAAQSLTNYAGDCNEVEKKLRAIGEKSRVGTLGMVERAKALRLLAYLKMPLEYMDDALYMIETFTTLTRAEPKIVTIFVADIHKILLKSPDVTNPLTLFEVNNIISDSPVPFDDFLKAFQDSRRIVLSGKMPADIYFREVRRHLDQGIAPEDMLEVLQQEQES